MTYQMCAELFVIEEDPDWNLMTFSTPIKEQKSDVPLKKLLGIQPNHLTQKIFHGGGKTQNLWTFKDKICVPVKSQKKVKIKNPSIETLLNG